MSRFVVYIFGSLLLITFKVSAQRFGNNSRHSLDSVHVKADHFIFIDENAYYVKDDTVFLLSDTVEFHIKKNSMARTDSFYIKMEKRMSKSRASRLMYDLLFENQNKDQPHSEESSEQRFTPYETESIQSIKFKYLKVFGTDINDTLKLKENRWTKPLNSSHFHTRKWTVKKNLQFKEGEQISSDAMVDSERLLRRQDYIKDARIFVDDSKGNGNADVTVVTRDVFPYNFLWSPNIGYDALFGISNVNIAGIGHELEFDHIESGDEEIEHGGAEFFYRIRNVRNTFIDFELNTSNHFWKSGEGLFLRKEFITQETEYAGGFDYSKYEHGEFNYDPIADTLLPIFYGLKYRDFWIAKSFSTSVISNLIGFKESTRVIAAFRMERYDHFDRPLVTADTNYRFYDRDNYMLSLGLTSRTYSKDRFILQYGRTEDIPTGSTLWGVLGHQSGEFKNRKYIGGNYARGGYVDGFGYLNTIYSLGGFISKSGFEDGVIKVGADYFTKLYTLNQFKFRQFIDVTFAQAIDPSEEPIIGSQRDLGVRGLSGVFLRSTTKFNVKFESLLFTPVNILGFKLAIFGFFDVTAAGNHKSDFFKSDTYMGMGGGIRVRNDNLAFSTIQLRFGYYPRKPTNSTHDLIHFATSANITIRDFFFSAPEVLQFN